MNQLDLVTVRTADELELEAAVFGEGKKGVVLIHGVGNSFYRTPLLAVAKVLGNNGYMVLCPNTRGHDWIARSTNGQKVMGASFETIEESLLDIDAFIEFLRSSGCEEVALVGHSLGAAKVIYYSATRNSSDLVKTVISCSSADMAYERRHEKYDGFDEVLTHAQRAISEDRPLEILELKKKDGTHEYYSAKTLVNKYGPEDRANGLNHVRLVKVPLLLLVGGKETRTIRTTHMLDKASVSPRKEIVVIEGAEHFYSEHEGEVAAALLKWLNEVM
ncbi:MAG: hypothetical protein CMO12_04580 [Thaumarchaeota archaeon]|nr:hypothetical protein [Nitrososphaerota archaeon]